jgi:hypothetical protein
MVRIAVSLLALLVLLAGLPLATGLAQKEPVSVQIAKDKVTFALGKEEVGVYHTAGYSKPILWPAYAPGHVHVTRDWPMGEATPGGSKDHPHHQSVWFCHGDVIPKGIQLKSKIKGVDGVDFWSLAPNHGKIVCTDVKKGKSGSNFASIDTANEWRTAEGDKIMDEKRSLILYDLGNARLWVFDIDLNASVCPIVFGDTKEGSMAFRIHDGLREKGGSGVIQNAEGKKTEKDCWGFKSAWCDYSGTLDGKKVGIAVLDDPHNPPACYHARAYGLMGANPFGRKKSAFPDAKDNPKLIELAKGEHLHLRYGILIHAGTTGEIDMPAIYKQFVKLGEKQ